MTLPCMYRAAAFFLVRAAKNSSKKRLTLTLR